MSLKGFHILFVAVSTILCVGFGVWAIRHYYTSGDRALLVVGVGSFVGAVALLVYGRWFWRKLRGVP